MIALETLEHRTFTPLVGKVFTVAAGEGVELTLKEARSLGQKRLEAYREPFALTFQGAQSLRLPQSIYRLSCPELGELELFMTQVSGNAQGSEFEAIFS